MDNKENQLIHEFSQVSLDMHDWEKYFHLATRIKKNKNQELIKSGEKWDKLYVLYQGEAQLTRLSQDGKERILWRGIAPCLLGEGPFFDGLPTLSSFIVTKPSVMYTFPREIVYSVLIKDPAIALSIIRNLAHKIRLVNNQNSCFSFSELSARICMYLYHKMQQSEDKKQYFAVPELTQQDLANHLAVHRVTLNKALRHLEQQGIIGPYNKKITYILDFETFMSLIQN